jgi:hypothetical protein
MIGHFEIDVLIEMGEWNLLLMNSFHIELMP